MRKIYSIEPAGWPCTLGACPPGLFKFHEAFGFKSEYGPLEAFVSESGEYFWGGAKSNEERALLIVQPCIIAERDIEE
jgi:hypothetical protein